MTNKMTTMEALNTIAQVLNATLAGYDNRTDSVTEEEAEGIDAITDALAWVEKKIAQEVRRKEYQATHPSKKKVDPEVAERRATVKGALTSEPQTAKELAEKTGLTPGQVNGALRTLVSVGRAAKIDNGGKNPKTYTLPSDAA